MRKRPEWCPHYSGTLVGYPCGLPFLHEGDHAKVTSRTTSGGQEVRRTTVKWPRTRFTRRERRWMKRDAKVQR